MGAQAGSQGARAFKLRAKLSTRTIRNRARAKGVRMGASHFIAAPATTTAITTAALRVVVSRGVGALGSPGWAASVPGADFALEALTMGRLSRRAGTASIGLAGGFQFAPVWYRPRWRKIVTRPRLRWNSRHTSIV